MITTIFAFITVMFLILILLFSPKYRQQSKILDWVYRTIYKPFFISTDTHKWKFYLVPTFYFILYNYLAFYLFYFKLSGEMLKYKMCGVFEIAVIIPMLLFVPLISGALCYTNSVKYQMQNNNNNNNNNNNYQNITSITYPFDGIIYHENTNCRTCHVMKPARSKHCSICNTCIPFQDHHCVWFNCCISGSNYKYFYCFLVSNTVILIYGFVRLICIQYFNKRNIIKIPATYKQSIMVLGILCLCFALLLIWFIYVQLDFIQQGMTTNESDKWYGIHQLIEEKLLVKSTKSQKYYELYKPDKSEMEINTTKNTSNLNSSMNTDDHHNIETFAISLNLEDKKIYNLGSSYEIIQTPYQIENIYDRGNFLDNLKERIG